MEEGGSGWVKDDPGRVNLMTGPLIYTDTEFDCGNDVNSEDEMDGFVSRIPNKNGTKVVVHDPLASWSGIEFGDLLARAEMAKMEPLLDFSSDSVRCRNSGFFLPGSGGVAVDVPTWTNNKLISETKGVSVKETAIREKLHSDQTQISAARITTLNENSSTPEQEEKQITDLNVTPQQKAKRRKHRPKVVIEGKVKKSRKETTSISTPKSTEVAEKRKYVRKKKSDDTDNTTSKRKYVRKKVPTKSLPIPTAESRLDGSKNCTRSCRKVLDFNYCDSQASDNRQQPALGSKETPILLSDTDTDQEREFSNTSGIRNGVQQRQQVRRVKKEKYYNLSRSVDAMSRGHRSVCNAQYSSLRTYQQLSKNVCNARVKFDDLVHHKGDKHSSITSSTVPTARNNGKLVKERWHSDPMAPPTSSTTVQVSIKNEKEITDTRPAEESNTDINSIQNFLGNQASLNNHLEGGCKPCTTLTASQDQARLARRNRIQRRKQKNNAMWEYLISVDYIVERLKDLDINRETKTTHQRCNALVPLETGYSKKRLHDSRRNRMEERKELVLYNHNVTLIPFDSSQNKKRRPRAKVELDEETSRVWRLLLENINSQGVDGTNEEKERWWENERKVFSGRANSFIARMHLVQGDRRFSKWKGSVVDSVVGVFLTQNVSDHLSSSAFMSLAARFPLKPYSNDEQYHKEASCCANTVHVMHPEDSISNDPISGQVSSVSNFEHIEQKVVSSSEGASNSGAMSSTDEPICKLTASGSEQQKTVETIGTQLNGKGAVEMSCTAEHQQSQLDEVVSSQSSATTYQSSLESSPSQTGDQEGLYSERNTYFDPAFVSLPQAYGGSTSFLELLQIVGCSGNKGGSLRGCGEEATVNDVQHRVDDLILHDQLKSKMDRSNDSTGSSIELGILSSDHAVKDTSFRPSEGSKDQASNAFVNKTYTSDRAFYESNIESLKAKRRRVGKDIDHRFDWEGLRKETQVNGKTRVKTPETMDSLDYEAVRSAEVNDIAYTIRDRGMNNVLAGRIKDFLDRLVNEHGSIDLEWLRDVPPDQAKEYLLSIRGLGLKSVECVRLLTLHHLAFPVDTNVGRIAVRLGWVPLKPLPESLQLHLLEMYPVQESIQKYLWPRLCKLDQKTLYELHYQMITFGKVFCTKSKPNCNSCPMRGECRHFASAFASARLALPGPEEKRIVPSTEQRESTQRFGQVPEGLSGQIPLLPPIVCSQQDSQNNLQISQLSESQSRLISCEPTIEEPKSPDVECVQIEENDIEDGCYEESDEIPEIKLNIKEFTQSLQNYIHENMELEEGDVSRALVALTPEAASIPVPKLKNVSMLRTEHHVYELPDTHPLLEGLEKREPDDPCSYLLAIWTPGETANSVQPPEACTSGKTDKFCDKETCFSCNSSREANFHTVRGTLLIPCRTAMRGIFPLNGTYFQVNEVFADHASSLKPMNIPRKWLWNLPRRTVYFGTSIPTIFKGLSTEGIQQCFWRGYICVRGFDQKSRAPRPLLARLHFPASKVSRTRGKPSGE